MIRLFRWIKREIYHILPVFIYFFLAFNFINFTEYYLLKRAGISPFTFIEVTAAAAVIAKVLLVIDHLPFVDLFPKKPLIFNVVWKTFIYWAITAIVRLLIRLIPFLTQGINAGTARFYEQMHWRLFAIILAWYLILFFIFVTARELTFKIGTDKMRRIFFG